jgi:hypothetical protein
MGITENIRSKVRNKDFNGTVERIRRACEEVFEYSLKGECNSEEALNNKNKSSPVFYFEEETKGTKTITITNIREAVPIVKLDDSCTIEADKCWHYGKKTREGPEGVVTNLAYIRSNKGIFLDTENPILPSIRVFGYGGDWMLGGNKTSIHSFPCIRNNFNIPPYVLISKIDFESFLKAIERKEKSLCDITL